MPLQGLRELLRAPIVGLKDHGTHQDLPSFCEKLGLPAPGPEGSKRERMEASFNSLDDAELPRVAQRFLRSFPCSAELRNRIEELLWTHTTCPEVPKRYRRELANRLSGETLYINPRYFEALLERLWVIDDHPIGALLSDRPCGLRAEIQQHVIRNPDDWTVDYLFERLGAYDCSDRRFLLFLEGLASADVRPDVTEQRRFVKIVNESLRPCCVELQITGTDGGYPVYTGVSVTTGVRASPKNLIFASQIKPDLRLRDAINNDVEIVTNAERVLVYDRPFGVAGLCWKELQDWWSDRESLTAEVAKSTLYKRLLESLPADSPPQRLFFQSYFKHFRQAIPALPALLPEVWLHWDPKTAEERGPEALFRFRMDFLMLFPNSVRVVIEVDGKHHYSDNNGQASTSAYAAMMEADRDLRLAGYEVYRFGAQELNATHGSAVAVDFFERLFRLHHVSVPRP